MNRRPIEDQAAIKSLNANEAAWRRNLGQGMDDELRGDRPNWWCGVDPVSLTPVAI